MSQQRTFREFAEFATDDESWRLLAGQLLAAAEALEPDIERYWEAEEQLRQRRHEGRLYLQTQADVRSIYFMLVAYAVENLCKGLLIRKQEDRIAESIQQSGKLPWKILGHNLAALLRQIDFPLTDEDEELAFRLERCSVWSARYPVPIAAGHRTVTLRTDDGEEAVPRWHSPDDAATVREFVTRIEQFVDGAMRA